MRLSTLGIWIEFGKDRLCRVWPWKRGYPLKWYSQNLDTYFPSKQSYMENFSKFERKRGENQIGIDLGEILLEWVQFSYSKQIIVVLFDINVAEKSSTFWDKVPYDRRSVFVKDVVILKCKDIRQAVQIVDSTYSNFAKAFAFKNGKIIYRNDLVNEVL